jgi:hypothetical protein
MMGFWDKALKISLATVIFLKNSAVIVANEAEKYAGEINEIQENYRDKDDKELISIVKASRSSSAEVGAARKILRERHGVASNR